MCVGITKSIPSVLLLKYYCGLTFKVLLLGQELRVTDLI